MCIDMQTKILQYKVDFIYPLIKIRSPVHYTGCPGILNKLLPSQPSQALII